MTTTWTPDTCSCVHVQDDDGGGGVAHVKTLNVCAAHLGLVGLPSFSQCLKENQAKNNLRQLAAQSVVKLRKAIINPDGSTTIDLADSVDYRWSFTGVGLARAMTAQFVGVTLTNAEKKAIADAVKANALLVPLTVTVL